MTRLRRIVIANDFAVLNGGQAKVAIDSARLLAEAGYLVDYFAAVGPVDPSLERPGITVHCLEQHDILSDPDRRRAVLQGLWNREAAAALAALCDGADAERTVLHCHGFAKALSPSIGPVLTGGPLRSVFTMHEYFLACPGGGFYDHQGQEICRRRPLGYDCLTTNCDVRSYVHKGWRVTRQVALRTAGRLPRRLVDVIYISRLQEQVMRPFLPASARLHYVPNPIARGDADVDAERNDIFLFIGRLSPEKGGRLFAEAARAAGVRAVFVGDGSERAEIERRCPDALVTGWLDRNEVAGWLARARCLVFPSLWYECQPLVPLEALARGVPVITGSWNAAAEVVEHGRNGLVIDRPDVSSLARAIEAMKAPGHPVFREIRMHPPPGSTEAEHLDRLLQVYEEILDEAR